jgi:HD-GYP domain-containing protein (c-di-GMP phosphodiesterase class II)
MTEGMADQVRSRRRASAKRPAKGKRASRTGRRTPKGGEKLGTAALERRIEKLTSLLDVAKALTAERELDNLLKMILNEAVGVVSADRCTLWIVDPDRNELWTKVAQGLGADVIRIPIGVGIAGQVASTGQIINIPDAYADPRFNRQVDKDTGYRTRNILGVPMRSHTGEVTGVLQALNKRDGVAFNGEDEELMLALGSNAATAIENAILYEEIDQLFEGFVKASVIAIESRDPTTSGHSERVALLTMGIAENVDKVADGPYSSLNFSREDMREIRYAALLHDFGKVGVREHVLTKAKKLYPGELEVIETRFMALRSQREATYLRTMLEAIRKGAPINPDYEDAMKRQLEELDELLEFVRKCNQPTVLESGGFERLRDIAKITFQLKADVAAPVLNERELGRLSIPRGTLDTDERLEIESHVTHTFRFLAQIPWTRNLRRVPEIAYAHHEKLDGAGYPRQLQADQIPLQSRMMTIADIYDALTASDRPYKKAVPHDKAVDILAQEAKMNRVDRHLLDIFVEAKVHTSVLNA